MDCQPSARNDEGGRGRNDGEEERAIVIPPSKSEVKESFCDRPQDVLSDEGGRVKKGVKKGIEKG